MQIRFIISLLIALFVAVFAINNAGVVSINLFFNTVEMSQAVVIFISIAVGAVVVSLLGLSGFWQIKRENKTYKDQVKKLADENNVLVMRLREKTMHKEIEVNVNAKEEVEKDELKREN